MSIHLEADEAQRGQCNDGYNPYPSQLQAFMNHPDPRQAQSQGVIQFQHGRHDSHQHNGHTNSRSSTVLSASLPNPHEQHSREGFTLSVTYSATSSSSPQLPLNHSNSPEYNPYDEPQIHMSSPPPSSRSELASYNSRGTLRDGSFSPRSTIVGSLIPGANDAPSETSTWQAPQRGPRRHNTIKTVPLFNGNFVLDCQVPLKLLDSCTFRHEREFTHMRYTAATCDPNDFQEAKFTLRQSFYDPPRHTELFIVITMYNENEVLFCRTMHSVMKNIEGLCQRGRSRMWGKDGWKKVVVCIVSDGRQKINHRTLNVLTTMGVYQKNVAKNMVNGREVTAHIYEYTTQVSVTPEMKIENANNGIIPVQIIFCLKEKNEKKINSHRWFFNAFAPILNPTICVLLDVGTKPGPSSLYHLWKAFDVYPNVGGACGEIVAEKGKYGQHLLQPLVAAQNFEYKMSNILDKPLESVLGYITVLPGAFSAYRYKALKNDDAGEGPLKKYFLGEKMHGAGADIFTANMYLAEDRILCWELVSKRNEAWLLHYVKSAYAHTDVPDGIPELISQRRRWLNGSFFAAVHSIFHFSYIYRSKHSFLRKFWLHVEMLYQVYNLVFSWFALGNYYIAFVILTQELENYLPVFHYPNLVLDYFYLGLLVMCFLLSLGNRPQGSRVAYTLAIIGFSFITIYMTASAALLAYKGVEQVALAEGRGIEAKDFLANTLFRNIVLSLAATLGLYIVSSLLSFEPWHMITSFIPYLLMAPSYIAVFNVFAFANVHDVSWGTKGDNKASDLGAVSVLKGGNEVQVAMVEEKDVDDAYNDAAKDLSAKLAKVKEEVDTETQKADYYKTFRTNVLLFWTLSNALLAVVVLSIIPDLGGGIGSNFRRVYMTFILFSITGLAFIRFVGSTAYLIVRLFVME